MMADQRRTSARSVSSKQRPQQQNSRLALLGDSDSSLDDAIPGKKSPKRNDEPTSKNKKGKTKDGSSSAKQAGLSFFNNATDKLLQQRRQQNMQDSAESCSGILNGASNGRSLAITARPSANEFLNSEDEKAARRKRQMALDLQPKATAKVTRDSQQNAKRTRRSSSPVKETQRQTANFELADAWTTAYAPESVNELGLHKRKVQTVRDWLLSAFSGRTNQRVLVLKGPAGAGKTATIRTLAADLGVDIKAWTEPVSQTATRSDEKRSQAHQFSQFLSDGFEFGGLELVTDDSDDDSRAKKPKREGSDNTKRMLLVEEYPALGGNNNAVTSFRQSIEMYIAACARSDAFSRSRCLDHDANTVPLIFVITESVLSSGSSLFRKDAFTAHRIFGPELLNHPCVSVIEFNPVAPTFLSKALKLVAAKHAAATDSFFSLPQPVLARLAEFGDLRNAISTLEFIVSRSLELFYAKNQAKRQKDEQIVRVLNLIEMRETNVGIFHAVSKVLYNKRNEEAPPDESELYHQPEQARRLLPLTVDVDRLLDTSGSDTNLFLASLHENYALSCHVADESLRDMSTSRVMSECIDALSESDVLLSAGFGNSSNGSSSRTPHARQLVGSTAEGLTHDALAFHAGVAGILYYLPYPVQRRGEASNSDYVSNWDFSSDTASITAGSTRDNKSWHGSNKPAAFKMYYPTGERLWRMREDVEEAQAGCLAVLRRVSGNPLNTTPLLAGLTARAPEVAVERLPWLLAVTGPSFHPRLAQHLAEQRLYRRATVQASSSSIGIRQFNQQAFLEDGDDGDEALPAATEWVQHPSRHVANTQRVAGAGLEALLQGASDDEEVDVVDSDDEMWDGFFSEDL